MLASQGCEFQEDTRQIAEKILHISDDNGLTMVGLHIQSLASATADRDGSARGGPEPSVGIGTSMWKEVVATARPTTDKPRGATTSTGSEADEQIGHPMMIDR